MRILIAYATKNGVSQRCAELLAEQLPDAFRVTLFRADEKEDLPLPRDFDVVVLGGSIRYGKLSGALRRYLSRHRETLAEKHFAFFVCCGFPDRVDEYAEDNLPKGLVPSLGVHCFGGELKPEKLKGFDRFVVRSVRKSIVEHDFEDGHYEGALPEIMPDHIARLVDTLRTLL